MIDSSSSKTPTRRRALTRAAGQADHSFQRLNVRQAAGVINYGHRCAARAGANLHVGAFLHTAIIVPTCADIDRRCVVGAPVIDECCIMPPWGALWSTYTRFAGACAGGEA